MTSDSYGPPPSGPAEDPTHPQTPPTPPAPPYDPWRDAPAPSQATPPQYPTPPGTYPPPAAPPPMAPPVPAQYSAPDEPSPAYAPAAPPPAAAPVDATQQFPPTTYGSPQYAQPPQYAPPQYAPPQYAPGQATPGQYPPSYGQPVGYPMPGQAPIPPPAPKKRGAVKVIGSVLSFILILAVVVVAKTGVRSILDGLGNNSHPTTAPPSGISATSENTAAPTGPYEKTPAAEYPEGEAGITLPTAAAVPGFTKSQVAANLAKVKQGMIAARLDPTMLTGHDTSKLLGLLAPDTRDNIKKEYFDKDDFFFLATQIAPGYTLTSDPIRSKGRVTFRGKKDNGVRLLEVITNFVWVYPFSGELKEPGDHLVVMHDEVTWVFPADNDVEKNSRGMWIDGAQAYASNIDCDLLDKSLLALGKPKVVPIGSGNQDDDAAFDPNGSLDIKSTC
jgi:hypothetical protein